MQTLTINLDERIDQVLNGGNVLIHGETRTGKTTLLLKAIARFQHLNPNAIVFLLATDVDTSEHGLGGSSFTHQSDPSKYGVTLGRVLEILQARAWGCIKSPPVLLGYDFDPGRGQLVDDPEVLSNILLQGQQSGITTWIAAQPDTSHGTRISTALRKNMTKIHLQR